MAKSYIIVGVNKPGIDIAGELIRHGRGHVVGFIDDVADKEKVIVSDGRNAHELNVIGKDTEIIESLNNDFVSIKVNCESNLELDVDGYKITERNLARAEYAVRGYPTYWFLKSEATRIAPLSGYQESNRLKDILFYIKNNFSDKMKYDEYIKKGGRKGKF